MLYNKYKPISTMIFLCLSEKKMPLIKTTPRKEQKCPMCKFRSFDLEVMKKHITDCGLRQLERRYICDREDCDFATNKLGNLTRHMADLVHA